MARWVKTPLARQTADGFFRPPEEPSANNFDPCRVYWGSHGCRLERGHDGPHLCECADWPEWQTDDEAENVGAPPYYGPDTNFYGEDA